MFTAGEGVLRRPSAAAELLLFLCFVLCFVYGFFLHAVGLAGGVGTIGLKCGYSLWSRGWRPALTPPPLRFTLYGIERCHCANNYARV